MSVSYLLRVEAVNLANFVYDTSRLPTVRGGGLLLLRAIPRVGAWLREDSRVRDVETLRAGASAGVFRFRAEASSCAEIRDDLERMLAKDHELRHATFVVDVLAASGDFRGDVERLIALNRFRQARSPSVVVPEDDGSGACAVDGIRPAAIEVPAPGGGSERVSRSVAVRTDYGREQRQEFYREETEEDGNVPAFIEKMTFTSDFQQLATDSTQGRLDGRMAVLYLDGNRFGELQRELCTGEEQQKAFDDKLLRLKRSLLRGVLETVDSTPGGWLTSDDAYRFEVLLWGGDEFLMVVPSWKGWWLVSEVLGRLEKWSFEKRPLRFAAGLVLCRARAPIRRIRRIAENLAGEAKRVSREENLIAYQVLESYDLVPDDLVAFRALRSPGGDPSQLLVSGDKARALGDAVLGLREVTPRRRLFRRAREILAAADGGEREALDALEELRRLTPGAGATWDAIEAASRSPGAALIHLVELWDYITTDSEASETGTGQLREEAG